MKKFWQKLSYWKKGFFIGSVLSASLMIFPLLVKLVGPSQKLCMQGGWLDVVYVECSIGEYIFTYFFMLIFSLWWLFALVLVVPTFLGYIIGRFKQK